MLIGCDAATAKRVIDTIRGLVSSDVTASAGITELVAGESLADALGRADAALYQAKRDGRDRAVIATT